MSESESTDIGQIRAYHAAELMKQLRKVVQACEPNPKGCETNNLRSQPSATLELPQNKTVLRNLSHSPQNKSRTDMVLVAEAANGREAIQQFRTHRPDVTLMDLQMPEMNGLDALIAIRTEFPDARIIMLTTYEGDVHILRALKAGAQGYLLKNTLHSELLQTIRAVHAGKRSLSPEVSFQTAEHMSDEAVTPVEVVVLRLIAAGNANKEIADQLGITEDTVKGRVKSILSKLDVNDRTHAAIIGLKRGIIEL